MDQRRQIGDKHRVPLLQEKSPQELEKLNLLLREERSDILCYSTPVYMFFSQKIDTNSIDINHLME
jgi:hypothetical protein